jgi:hypothetical protein
MDLAVREQPRQTRVVVNSPDVQHKESLAGSKVGILTLLSRAHPQHLGGAEVLEVWAVAVSCSVRAPGGHGGRDCAVARSLSARCGA